MCRWSSKAHTNAIAMTAKDQLDGPLGKFLFASQMKNAIEGTKNRAPLINPALSFVGFAFQSSINASKKRNDNTFTTFLMDGLLCSGEASMSERGFQQQRRIGCRPLSRISQCLHRME